MPLYTRNGQLLIVGELLAANQNCCCNDCYSLLITYDWSGSTSRDLDTGTTFLGTKVGYSCGGISPYITWGGDNTGTGSQETATVNFWQALLDNQWQGSTSVELYAGWFTPAGGSGPITVRVRCLNGGPEQSRVVNPGTQNGCANTQVATITIDENGTFVLN